MEHRFLRTEMVLGDRALDRLSRCHVAVFGLGGVGSYAAEILARSGVGELTLVDQDTLSLTNINRQLYALHSTVGQPKAETAARRCRDINPALRVHPVCATYDAAHRDDFFTAHYDYIVDAIDTVSGKLALITNARKAGTPIICSMGAGNKLDPTAFRVADIYETSVDALARVIRRECRKRGIDHLKVVYSQEEARRPIENMEISCRNHCICPPDTARKCTARRDIPGSNAFVPSVVGLIIAGEVIKDITGVR